MGLSVPRSFRQKVRQRKATLRRNAVWLFWLELHFGQINAVSNLRAAFLHELAFLRGALTVHCADTSCYNVMFLIV